MCRWIGVFLVFLVALQVEANTQQEQQIQQEVRAWFLELESAFNELDYGKLVAMANLPNYRLAMGKMAVIDEAAYRDRISKMKGYLENTGWAYTRYEVIDFIHTGANKVHVSTTFSRYRTDDSRIGTWTSLYILTKENGKWGLKLRSSWAPLTGVN